MNHFSSKLTSPLLSIIGGYIYVGILILALYFLDFYKDSNFFIWGPPVVLIGKTIDDEFSYYIILLVFFIHQLINNWINEVTYPWIINCVQDPKSKRIGYSNRTSILIINLFSLYSEIDVLLIIAGVMSQLSFFVVIIVANMISVTVINWQYIKRKHKIDFCDQLTTMYEPNKALEYSFESLV